MFLLFRSPASTVAEEDELPAQEQAWRKHRFMQTNRLDCQSALRTKETEELRMARPNILFILTDQQRFDTLGANGNEICRTPSTDRLALEGMNFTHAFTPTSLCSPARASLLTGLYSHNHTMINLTNAPVSGVSDLPDHLDDLLETDGGSLARASALRDHSAKVATRGGDLEPKCRREPCGSIMYAN